MEDFYFACKIFAISKINTLALYLFLTEPITFIYLLITAYFIKHITYLDNTTSSIYKQNETFSFTLCFPLSRKCNNYFQSILDVTNVRISQDFVYLPTSVGHALRHSSKICRK